jgi:hypothetical protein
MIQSLAICLRKNKEWSGLFKAKIRFLRSLTFPTTLIWLLNLGFIPRKFHMPYGLRPTAKYDSDTT